MENANRFHYEVHMGGRVAAKFQEVENLYIEKDIPENLDCVILRNGEGDDTFLKWREEMLAGKILKKRVEVWLYYKEKDIVAKWALISACLDGYEEGSCRMPEEKLEIREIRLSYRCIDKWVVNTAEEFHSDWYDIDGCDSEQGEENSRTV